MPRAPQEHRCRAVRLVRIELQARLQASNGMQVDFLDTFLLSSVGSQRKALEDKMNAASPELLHLIRTSLVCHFPTVQGGGGNMPKGGGGARRASASCGKISGGTSTSRASGGSGSGGGRLVAESPRFSTREVIDKAINTMVCQDANAPWPNPHKSVLAHGFRLVRSNNGFHQGSLPKGSLTGGRAKSMQGVQSVYPNTTLNVLSSKAFQQLHATIGDGLFLHILVHTATLLLLPNTCFLQITGPLLGNLLNKKTSHSRPAHHSSLHKSPNRSQSAQRVDSIFREQQQAHATGACIPPIQASGRNKDRSRQGKRATRAKSNTDQHAQTEAHRGCAGTSASRADGHTEGNSSGQPGGGSTAGRVGLKMSRRQRHLLRIAAERCAPMATPHSAGVVAALLLLLTAAVILLLLTKKQQQQELLLLRASQFDLCKST
jgi:hypothetical protein